MNDDRKEIPFPSLVEPSQEIGLLIAIQAQLKQLERIPPCERRNSLEVRLTEMLNVPFIPSATSLQQKLREADAEIKRLRERNESLISQLQKTLSSNEVVIGKASDQPLSSESQRPKKPQGLINRMFGSTDEGPKGCP